MDVFITSNSVAIAAAGMLLTDSKAAARVAAALLPMCWDRLPSYSWKSPTQPECARHMASATFKNKFAVPKSTSVAAGCACVGKVTLTELPLLQGLTLTTFSRRTF